MTESVVKRRTASHWGTYLAEVRDGRFVGVEPFMKDNDPSPMISAMPQVVYDDLRINQPMARRGWLNRKDRDDGKQRGADSFVPLPWDEALDLLSEELHRIKLNYGNEAIFGGSYGWASAGRFHHARSLLHRFLACFGGFTQQVGNYSYGAGMAVLPHIIGSYDAIEGPLSFYSGIASNTRLFVSFGGIPLKNAQIDAGGLGEHTTSMWLQRLREAGVDFVCISPVREEGTDFLEAEWLMPRPNTDTAIMLGLAHTLVSENLHDNNFLERYCIGFEQFLSYLLGNRDGQPKDAEWASKISGIKPKVIRDLARRMASQRTMINTSWSVQRCDHGEEPIWMTVALAAILGQIGLPGGGFGFGYSSTGGMGTPRPFFSSPKHQATPNPINRYIPVARVVDMLLQPGQNLEFNGTSLTYPDIRLIYWAGGNPFHHHQDLNRLLKAWRKPDTIVVHEPWWTATARHADLVLPVTTTLERNDIGACRRDKYIVAMEKVIDPVGQSRDDYHIFSDLAERLGIVDTFTENRTEMDWLRFFYDECQSNGEAKGYQVPSFDQFWHDGYVEHPEPHSSYDLLEMFRANPEEHPLHTTSGKIEIFCETIDKFGYEDCPGYPKWLEPLEWLGSSHAKRFALHLVTPQPRYRLHGQLDTADLSQKHKIQGREPIWINPQDANQRDICDGDVVRVYNDRGACLAGAFLTDRVRSGVVQLETGAWYSPAEAGETGTLECHGNPNVLTLDKGTSRLAQATSAGSCLVEIEPYQGALPAIEVLRPPPIDADNP